MTMTGTKATPGRAKREPAARGMTPREREAFERIFREDEETIRRLAKL